MSTHLTSKLFKKYPADDLLLLLTSVSPVRAPRSVLGALLDGLSFLYGADVLKAEAEGEMSKVGS